MKSLLNLENVSKIGSAFHRIITCHRVMLQQTLLSISRDYTFLRTCLSLEGEGSVSGTPNYGASTSREYIESGKGNALLKTRYFTRFYI